MNRKRKISIIILLALMVVVLSSCDNVYSSGISGKVVDNSGQGIAGVSVYAYTSKDSWDRAYESYKPGNIFKDNSCQFSAQSTANGVFNITPFVWKTSNSPWGKDYASTDVYLILFSKDYGIEKVDRTSIISSSAGNIGEIHMGNRITEETKLIIDFVVNGNTKIDGITTFDYSYNDGYNDIEGTFTTVEDGRATLNIQRLKTSSPTSVKVKNIQTNEDVWSAKDKEYTFEVDSRTSNGKIDMKRDYWYLENGISGEIEADFKSDISIGSCYAKVSIDNGDKDFRLEEIGNITDTTPSGEFNHRKAGVYQGLAKGEKVKTVYEDGTLQPLVVTVEILDSLNKPVEGAKIERKFGIKDSVSMLKMPTIKVNQEI